MTRLLTSLQAFGLIAFLPAWPAFSAEPGQATERHESVRIPRLEVAPTLEDFASMQPSSAVARSMARVDEFRQERPRDGDPASQRTEAYLGYDHSHLYIVFVCFDSEPEKIRARLSRREDLLRDDRIDVFLDTFNDQLRSYVFTVNPFGVQADANWVERDSNPYDPSFDTVWDSRGILTPDGYVVWMALPFKSLRFSPKETQEWGLLLSRTIPRANEASFWPYITTRIKGRLNE